MGTFKFGLGEELKFALNDRPCVVIGRAEHLIDENRYQVRFIASDGNQVEDWFAESALKSDEIDA